MPYSSSRWGGQNFSGAGPGMRLPAIRYLIVGKNELGLAFLYEDQIVANNMCEGGHSLVA